MNKNIVWAIVVILIIGIGAFYVKKAVSPSNVSTTATTTELGNTGIQVNSNGNGKIQILSDSASSLQTPSLDHETVFAKDVPTDARLKFTQQIKKLIGLLREDKTNFNAWMDLAIAYKVSGDIKQAEAIWLFLTDAAPAQGISAHNLGTFYHLTTKDFAKSEKYFQIAIKREPAQEINYLSFHELYRYSYKKDTNAAVDILKQGIKAIPDTIDMHLALATYYREDKKDLSKAITELQAARDSALKKGNSTLVNDLNKQISALKGQ